jgi:hypothetical protein
VSGRTLLAIGVLLDRHGNQEIMRRIRTAIEVHVDNRISDLHIRAIGPGIRAASITVVTSKPESPKHYKDPKRVKFSTLI